MRHPDEHTAAGTLLSAPGTAAYPRSTPRVARRSLVHGTNDLATTDPSLATEGDGSWDPKAVTRGSGRRVGWVCKKNSAHRWTAPISQRSQGTGCPVCANRLIVAGLNDLATTHPELARAGDGTWDPRLFLSGSHTKVNWICDVDRRHIYTCSINERARGVGCAICNGKVVVPGVNDLRALDPDLAGECDGSWDPSRFAQFSNTKVGWVCRNDDSHRWQAQIMNRSNGGGCPGCATSGYNVTAPGWLYLVRDADRGLLQIGISNHPAQRLSHHNRNGWTTIDVVGPFDGDLCYDWEQSILRYLRSHGAPEPGHLDRFEGVTEAWSHDDLLVSSIQELRQLVWNSDHARP